MSFPTPEFGYGSSVAGYEPLEEFTHHGTGHVYRARDQKTGAVVAVKELHRIGSEEIEALRREVNVLQRIDHPGIVRVLEAGLEDSPPWYAMEYIEGGTLHDRWQCDEGGRRPDPEAVSRSLNLLSRLCEPLSYLHEEGIVHRDLKPRNIGIRGDDQPVIVDFDLASHFGAVLAHEELETGGLLTGSVPYMSPEQARGEYVDARTDLYSLGCIIYEAVTGHPPFVGSPAEIVQQHLDAEPEFIDDIDPKLADLIGRLLAKKPRERIGYALDVAAVMHTIGIGAGDAPTRRAGAYLYRPTFTGRECEVERLSRTLDNVKAGSGSSVFVAGESGSGKTRIVMEASREAAARGFRVLTGECAPTHLSTKEPHLERSPLGPLRSLLRAVVAECANGGVATTERLLGSRAKILAAYEPTLASVPGFAEQPEPLQTSVQGQRARTLSGLTDTLGELARSKPVLLILDDLQWADDLTLAWVDQLGRDSLEKVRVLFLGTYRREEMGPNLGRIASDHAAAVIELRQLTAGDVSSIVTDMLGTEAPPQELIRCLTCVSEGNPFVVCEYLRAAVEARFLNREVGGRWMVDFADQSGDPFRRSLPLPSSLREPLQRRIGDLDLGTMRVLEAAAVLGRDFETPLVETLACVDAREGIDAIRSLLQRRLIEASGPNRFRFMQDMTREVAYSQISEAKRIGLHRGAAIAIEDRYEGRSGGEERYAELAHHWSKAGDDEKSITYFSLGGAQALETGCYDDAHHLIIQALVRDEQLGRRCGPTQRARWHRMLGCAAFGNGDLVTSISYSTEALTELGERLPMTSTAWVALVGSESMKRACRRERRGVEPTESTREVALGYGQLATFYFFEGDVLPASATTLRGLRWAEQAGDEILVLKACARLGLVAGVLRCHRLSRGWFARAYRAARKFDDPGGRGLTLYLDAQCEQGQGRWRNAHSLAAEAVELLEGIGDSHEAEVARTTAANVLYYSGDLVGANQAIARFHETSDDRGHAQHLAWSHVLRARSSLVTGELEQAIADLEEAGSLLASLPESFSGAICEGTHATALWQAGRREESIAIADQLSRRLGSGRCLLVCQCLDAYGALADVYLSRAEQAGDEAEAERFAPAALAACRSLRWFARVFPMAVPAALRSTARERWMRGDRRGALRAWNQSAGAASRLGMPFWEACAHRDLAEHAASSHDKASHQREAQYLFRSLGAKRYLAEL